jgi:hypothetical protein
LLPSPADLARRTAQSAACSIQLLLLLSMLHCMDTGPEEAVQYVKQSGIKLCALGADGQALRDAGLQVGLRHRNPR